MLKITSDKKGPAVITQIMMSSDESPEEHYNTFIGVTLSFAQVMADGAKANGLEVNQKDVAVKIAEDLLRKVGAISEVKEE